MSVRKNEFGECSTHICPSSPFAIEPMKLVARGMYSGGFAGFARSMVANPEPLSKKLMKTFDEPEASSMRLIRADGTARLLTFQLRTIAPETTSTTSTRLACRSASITLPSQSGTMSVVEPTSSDLSWSSVSPLIDSPVQFATMAPGVGVSAMTTVEASAVSEPNVARTVAEPAPVPKKSPAAEMLPAPETTLQVTSPPSTRPSRHVAVAENLVGAGLLRYTVSGPDAA